MKRPSSASSLSPKDVKRKPVAPDLVSKDVRRKPASARDANETIDDALSMSEIPIVNALQDISLVICGGTDHPKCNQRAHDAPCIAPGTRGSLPVVPLEGNSEGLDEKNMKHWVEVRAAFPGYQRPAHVDSDDYWESDSHGVLEGEQDEADSCIREPIEGSVEPGYKHACVFQGMVWQHPQRGLVFEGTELYYNGMGGHLEDTCISLAACEGTAMRKLRRFSETYGIELSVAMATVENGASSTLALVVSQDVFVVNVAAESLKSGGEAVVITNLAGTVLAQLKRSDGDPPLTLRTVKDAFTKSRGCGIAMIQLIAVNGTVLRGPDDQDLMEALESAK